MGVGDGAVTRVLITFKGEDVDGSSLDVDSCCFGLGGGRAAKSAAPGVIVGAGVFELELEGKGKKPPGAPGVGLSGCMMRGGGRVL